MFASLEILFVLKYNRYHTNEILGFNSFEYFIVIFFLFFFFFVIYPNCLALFLKVLKILSEIFVLFCTKKNREYFVYFTLYFLK
jgi:hypothetical protein